MTRLLIILLVVCSPIASALTDSDAKKLWDRSLKAYSEENFEQSRNLLLYLVKAQPKNALYWFNLGNSYFMLDQHKYAETCFYKVETLGSRLAPAAKLYRSKALAARGERESAKRMLQHLLQAGQLPKALHDEASRDLLAFNQQPGEAEALEAEAIELYKEGKYRRALRLISKSEVKTDSLNMLKAMILIKLDRDDQAHTILREVERGGSEPLKDLAGSLLERIRNTYSKPKWLFVEAAGGHDSNIYGAPEATDAGTWATQAGGGGRFLARGLWYGTGGYSVRLREVFDHSDLRSLQHEVRLNLGREVASDLIAVSPFATHESTDGDPRLFRSGMALRWRTGHHGFEGGIDAELTGERALDGDYGFLTGSTQTYVVHGSVIKSPIYARVYLRWGRQDLGDDNSSGSVIPYAHRLLAPGLTILWRARADWAVEFGADYALREYPTPPSSGPKREDKELSLSARITKTLNPNFAIYSSLGSRQNKSTMGASSVSDENYSQFQVLAGVIWDAL